MAMTALPPARRDRKATRQDAPGAQRAPKGYSADAKMLITHAELTRALLDIKA
jgi:hypothetical protein